MGRGSRFVLSTGLLGAFFCLASPGWATSIKDVVSKVMPTVVSVYARGVTTASKEKPAQNAAFAVRINERLGSGFIIDPSGIIVTNRHVVDGVYQVLVTLSDGSVVEAKVLGQTLGFDVALLKIATEAPLKAAKLADSDKIAVGDDVFAIGNPLGFGESVSKGVVSALHRDLGISQFDEFIQTDASVNHGNSGGPLFNLTGEVVGINTAISTVDGGSNGLGFAIPSNDIKFLLDHLHEDGRVHLGWIGVQGQKITPDMANALNLDHAAGVILSGIVPDSPAAAAGLQIGDIIQKVNGEPLINFRALNRLVARTSGQKLAIELLRKGQMSKVELTIGEYPQPTWSSSVDKQTTPPDFDAATALGLKLTKPTSRLSKEFKLAANTVSPVVTAVSPQSVAANAGIEKGDVVLRIQFDNVTSPLSFQTMLMTLRQQGKRTIVLFLDGKKGPRWVSLNIG